jgi:hypothetical protein
MSQLTRRLFRPRVRPVLPTWSSGFTLGLTALRPTVVSTHKLHISTSPIAISKSVWNGARGFASKSDKVSRSFCCKGGAIICYYLWFDLFAFV